MIADPIPWDDPTPDPEEEYQSLLRALRWAEGFGLLFVRCSPAEGQALITRVTTDAPQKRVTTLTLDGTNWNFYDQVKHLPDRDSLDIVFVTGLETLLDEYLRPGYGSQGDYYAQDTAPRILSHLNLRRETLRDEFNICFVFLLPLYALKYIIRRAPDFFDWRSGVFEFIPDAEIVARESSRLLDGEDYYEFVNMTPQERRQCFLDLQTWLEENPQNSEQRAELLFKQGNLFAADQDFQSAIASYDKALAIKPDDHQAWNNRGNSLDELERYEAAIASYDKALEIKPDKHAAWNNRGNSLDELERYEAAIASYDKALEIKPDDHQAWYNRGISLRNLERYESAIASYDKALEIKPDKHEAWYNRGISLDELERYEAAIASYDKALEIKPDDHQAWYNRGNSLRKLERYEAAIASYDKALEIKSDDHQAWYNRGNSLRRLERYEAAIASYDKALEIKPDDHQAWNNRSASLIALKRYDEALKSCDRALSLKPDYANPYYVKARCFALMGQGDEAIDLLNQAIALEPEIRGWAQTNSEFDGLRDDARFQTLVGKRVEDKKVDTPRQTLSWLKALWHRDRP